MKHGKKPTRMQKIRMGKAGLGPDNWLVIRQEPDGRMILKNKHSGKIRVLPTLES